MSHTSHSGIVPPRPVGRSQRHCKVSGVVSEAPCRDMNQPAGDRAICHIGKLASEFKYRPNSTILDGFGVKRQEAVLSLEFCLRDGAFS